MTLGNVADVATAVSSVLAGLSILAGFLLYRTSRRDEELRSVRESMVLGRSAAKQLDSMLSHEFIYEVVSRITKSIVVSTFLSDVYDRCLSHTSEECEDLDSYLDNFMPVIFGSTDADLTRTYEVGLKTVETEAYKLLYDYPATARALYAARNVLRNAFYSQKQMVLSEDAWKHCLLQCKQNNPEGFATRDLFQSEVTQMFISTALNGLAQGGQETINDVMRAVDIVVDHYLEFSSAQLAKAARTQKSKELAPLQATETVASDIRELEKGMEGTLPTPELLNLREIATQIDAR